MGVGIVPLAADQIHPPADPRASRRRGNRPICVIYHANCADGFGAAYAAWCALGSDGVTYIPASYGDVPPHLPPESDVYVLDFSYPRPVLEEFRKSVSRCVVIDHHKTAEEDLRGLENVIFDLDHSGAALAWRCFQGTGNCIGPLPTLLHYVQDRDLWRWRLHASRAFNAGLDLYPRTFGAWHALDNPEGTRTLIAEGAIALRYQQQLVSRIADAARGELVGNYYVPTANTPILISETCAELLRRDPAAAFAANYFDSKNPITRERERIWSLRGRPGFDVSEIARRFKGGGGHVAAAGFRCVRTGAPLAP